VSLVVRVEALLLWVEDRVVVGEVEGGLLFVDLHLSLRERGLEAVGHALVVDAEDDRIAAVHLQTQLVVVVADARGLLAHRRLDPAVVGARLRFPHLRVDPERPAFDVEGERRVAQQRLPVHEHVVADAPRGADPHLDSLVGREDAVVPLLRRRLGAQTQQRDEQERGSLQ
jgi:hypothetical protein